MMPADALERVRAARSAIHPDSSREAWQPDEIRLAVRLRDEYGMCARCVAVFLELHGYPQRTARSVQTAVCRHRKRDAA